MEKKSKIVFKKCEHNKIRSRCVDCGGSSICEHKRERSKCVECGGSSICEHKRQRSICVECGGSSICEHKRQRRNCVECSFKLTLVNNQRGFIRRCLNADFTVNKDYHIEYIGCSASHLKEYLLSKMIYGMTPENIHIDHIKPVSAFNFDDEDEFNSCCHYTNLQPLLAEDNRFKYSKWTEENEAFWVNNIKYKEYIPLYGINNK